MLNKFNESLLDYDVIEVSAADYDKLVAESKEEMTPIEVKFLFEYMADYVKLEGMNYYTKYGKRVLSSFTKILDSQFKDKVHITQHHFPFFDVYFNYLKTSRHKYPEHSRLWITKTQDEWFIVRDLTKGKFYKIDQFEGLMEYLDRIFSKVPKIDKEYEELKVFTERKLEKIKNEYKNYTKEKLKTLYNAIKRL